MAGEILSASTQLTAPALQSLPETTTESGERLANKALEFSTQVKFAQASFDTIDPGTDAPYLDITPDQAVERLHYIADGFAEKGDDWTPAAELLRNYLSPRR